MTFSKDSISDKEYFTEGVKVGMRQAFILVDEIIDKLDCVSEIHKKDFCEIHDKVINTTDFEIELNKWKKQLK